MKFINIVGTTTSGKTTFSRQLAQKLDLVHIEMDDLFWLDNWQETPDDQFFLKLQNKMNAAKEGWVLDGNYSRTLPLKLVKLDTIIWLDYSFHINLYRLSKRTFGRVISRKKLWENSNNRESLKLMLSKESIFIWLIKSYPKNRKKYFDLMQNPAYQHIQFIRLTSPKRAAEFLQKIKSI